MPRTIVDEYPVLRGIRSFTVGFGNFCLFTLAFLLVIVALMFYGMAQIALGSVALGLTCPSLGDLLEIGAGAGVFSFLIPLVVVSIIYHLAKRYSPRARINARTSSFGAACARLAAWLFCGAMISTALQGVLAWAFLHDRSNGIWSAPDRYAPIETLDDPVTFAQVYKVSVVGAVICNTVAVILIAPIITLLLRRSRTESTGSADLEQLSLDEKSASAESRIAYGKPVLDHSAAPSSYEPSLTAYEPSVRSSKTMADPDFDCGKHGAMSGKYGSFRETESFRKSVSPWTKHDITTIEEK